MNLYSKLFAEINLAEQSSQRDSWAQHMSTCPWSTTSTTSLTLPCIVPTFHEDTRNLRILSN